jgi:glycosyltransferase involved in cell wall biosynthesis
MLRARGHQVTALEENNDSISGGWSSVSAAASSVYSRTWRRRISAAIARERPDILHVHNFFPRISPSVYYAAREGGVPVVQTLHNYRMLCPNGLLLRDNKPCIACLGKSFAWPGMVHRCYRGSRSGSAAVAAMLAAHRVAGTWETMVDAYVALTEFGRQMFIAGGYPAERIVVKPNFVRNRGVGGGQGGYGLFVGRISVEKGVRTMLEAWRRVACLPLKIAGDGPLRSELQREFRELANVEWLGGRPAAEVARLMADARALIFPSLYYEGMPLTMLEAFAAGTPVIASNLGAMAFMVEHGRNGLRFESGDVDDLATKVEWMWTHDSEWAAMRRAAREEFEEKYTEARNYDSLIATYELARRTRATAERGVTDSLTCGCADDRRS